MTAKHNSLEIPTQLSGHGVKIGRKIALDEEKTYRVPRQVRNQGHSVVPQGPDWLQFFTVKISQRVPH